MFIYCMYLKRNILARALVATQQWYAARAKRARLEEEQAAERRRMDEARDQLSREVRWCLPVGGLPAMRSSLCF
jgi:hypothetical protein